MTVPEINLQEIWSSYRQALYENETKSDLYGSLANPKDYALHTCGVDSFPSHLEPFGQSSLKTSEYRISDESEYAKKFLTLLRRCDFKDDLLDSFLQKYKGLFLVRADKWAQQWEPMNKSVPQIPYLETFCHGISNTLYEFVKQDRFAKNLLVTDPYLNDRIYKPDPHHRAMLFAKIGFRSLLEQRWECSHFTEKSCRLCQGVFWPQTTKEWVGNCPPDYCSFCLSLAFGSGGVLGTSHHNLDLLEVLDLDESGMRIQMEAAIKGFVEFAGFIPPSAFSIRQSLGLAIQEMNPSQADECLMWWGILPRSRDVKRFYPSWAHFLDKAGLLQSLPSQGLGGYRSVASDGHLCLSMPERTICEFLYESGIEHEKEPPYPEVGGFRGGNMRADWLIGDTFVEFAGMMSVPSYKDKMKKKIQMAADADLKLIVVEPKDLRDLSKLFAGFRKLNRAFPRFRD